MTEFAYRLKEFLLLVPRNLGKIVGGLIGMFLVKSSFAFFIGILLGHQFDRGLWGKQKNRFVGIDKLSPRKRITFIRIFFNVMGHIAKADGRVSEHEINVAKGMMAELKLKAQEQDLAIRSYTDGKDPEFPLAHTLQAFYREFRTHMTLREWFIRLQIQAALAGDGLSGVVSRLLVASAAQLDLHSKRVKELMREAHIYNAFTIYGRKPGEPVNQGNYFQRQKQKYSRYDNRHDEKFKQNSRTNYHRRQHSSGPSRGDKLAEAYILLGVSMGDSPKDITRAYRRLLSQNHPDKVAGRGGNKAERELANAKTIELRHAYELVKDKHNF